MSKILIISKDVNFAKMLKETLIFNGFIVEVAHEFNQVLKALQEINFALVLMEFEFFPEFSLLKFKSSVVVMGYCYEQLSKLGKMYSGMDDFLLKPFGIQELKMIINRQLEWKRLMLKPIIFGEMRIDVARSLVAVKDNFILLGKKELEIMIILARKAGKIVATDRLVTEQRMKVLTKKVRSIAGEAFQIRPIGRVGYKLILR